MLDYDISRDEREVVFTTSGSDGERQVWLESLDRRSAPLQIARQADQAAFVDSGVSSFGRSTSVDTQNR